MIEGRGSEEIKGMRNGGKFPMLGREIFLRNHTAYPRALGQESSENGDTSVQNLRRC